MDSDGQSESDGQSGSDGRFWSLIEAAVPEEGAGSEEHAEAVTEALKTLPAYELFEFDGFLTRQLIRAYRWDLWAVAYIGLGGCSDDGFEYFRLWLIAHGREYFERALADPERAVDALSPGDEGECESLGYAASYAFEEQTGNELPSDDTIERPTEPAGQAWEEDAVYGLYPKLTARFEGDA